MEEEKIRGRKKNKRRIKKRELITKKRVKRQIGREGGRGKEDRVIYMWRLLEIILVYTKDAATLLLCLHCFGNTVSVYT